MLHISLFSGIGGFDLASEWMGWQNIVSCEINPFSRKVLQHYWPNSYHHDDIHTLTYEKINQELTKKYGSNWRTNDIILTGGFPCQPYSVAGKRLGKEDERHLWPHMLRAIREIQPTWIVGENVRGLINWNGGLVFDEVQTDLEAEGYEVIPFILPACGVNAPHRRDRVWFVAYSDNARRSTGLRQVSGTDEEVPERNQDAQFSDAGCGVITNTISGSERSPRKSGGTVSNRSKNDSQSQEWRGETKLNIGCSSFLRDTTNATSEGLEGQDKRQQRTGNGTGFCIKNDWDNFPTKLPIHVRDDGIPRKLANFVVEEMHYEISKTSKDNRIENLQEVWQRVQQEEVWEQIRRLYSLESKDLLFQTMQLYSTGAKVKKQLSAFSQEVSKEPLRTLRKYGEFRSSPQGQKLEKQRFEQFGDTLSFLPHEVALAARAYTNSIRKFEAWHRSESIKAAGNAVVPQVVFQIFKAIQTVKDASGQSK